LSAVELYPNFEYPLGFLFILGIDIIGLVLVVIPKERSNQLGYAWIGVMSIVLWVFIFPFIGTTYLATDVIVILFLASVELLVDIKLVLDHLSKQIHEVEAL